MKTLPKLLILGGTLTAVGIAAVQVLRMRRRRKAMRGEDEVFGTDEVVVVVSEMDPIVIVAEEPPRPTP